MAYANTITDILNSWADFGIFAYVLPFLMIFAIVFGVLNKSKILGENKGVQVTIALAVGLLSLQFDYVSNFFAAIFPYAGMGLAILLVGLILTGLFVGDKDDWAKYVWYGLGAIIFIVVVLNSFTDYAWLGGKGYLLAESWKPILALIVIVGIVVLIATGSGKKKES